PTLSHDPIRPLPSVVLGRFDRKSHLLRDRSTDEAPDAVVLPFGRLDDIGDGGSLFPAQGFENDLLLRAASFPLRLGLPFGSSAVPFLGRLHAGLCSFGLLSTTLRCQH